MPLYNVYRLFLISSVTLVILILLTILHELRVSAIISHYFSFFVFFSMKIAVIDHSISLAPSAVFCNVIISASIPLQFYFIYYLT